MADAATWAKRVSDWRASGLTSIAFCTGKPYTPGGLRCWAHLLQERPRAKPKKTTIRIGRVLRVPAAAVAAKSAPTASTGESTPAATAVLIVELGAARVTVPQGFDRSTLVAVLDVLAARGGPR